MKIRTAVLSDLNAVSRIEALCFPPAEAASRQELERRLEVYPSHFWILEDGDTPVGFLNGMVTDEDTIRDELFADASLHDEQGAWQAVFGLDVLDAFRRQGWGAALMNRAIADARAQGRRGCILTCKEHLRRYYETFGYRDCGKSASVHGGAVWYDMRLRF